MIFFSKVIILTEVAETLDSNSKEDSLGQIESDSTEVLNLHSDNEFFTTVDNNSKEPAEKSKYLF